MDEDDADVLFTGTESSYWYVKALSDIDFDGDGFDDLFFGDYYYDGDTEGSVYFFPSADLSSGDLLDLSDDATTTFTGDSDGDYFGYTLGGGDLDFDGYDDLVSASAAEDVGGVERAGCVYVFMGDPSLPSGSASVGFAADMVICGTEAHGRLGRHGVLRSSTSTATSPWTSWVRPATCSAARRTRARSSSSLTTADSRARSVPTMRT